MTDAAVPPDRPTPGAAARFGPGGEFELLGRIIARLPLASTPDVLVGPGHDCAVIAGGRIAVSVDCSVEGVHFDRAWMAPEQIGYRAAAAALSDLAAAAARPIGLLATVAVPGAAPADLVSDIMAGMADAAGRAGAAVLGGDLSRSTGPLMIDVTVLGEVDTLITRAGSRPGDGVWVTGSLGAAAAAVDAWRAGRTPRDEATAAYLRPVPRTREARWLVERGLVHAMIDLSDGLAGDAAHLAAAGGVRIALALADIPVSDAARAAAADPGAALRLALGGGEDYELCFTGEDAAMREARPEFEREFGTRLTRVGTVEDGDGIVALGSDGVARPLDVGGWSHFATGQG